MGIVDPLRFAELMWPSVRFYNKQRDVIYSVVENDETFVHAGNMLGKDFVAAFIVLWFFMTRYPCRIVTTSADHAQLESVLWGEIRRFIQSSKVNLDSEYGGPLVINHLHLRRVVPNSPKRQTCGVSYCIARVAAKGEGMLGHHVTTASSQYVDDDIPRTLFVADEASGVEDVTYDRADTWAQRKLVIGNPYPCNNFFYRGVEGGDLEARSDEVVFPGGSD